MPGCLATEHIFYFIVDGNHIIMSFMKIHVTIRHYQYVAHLPGPGG